MATLLRNSLLAQSTDISNPTPTDLSNYIPPPLPNVPLSNPPAINDDTTSTTQSPATKQPTSAGDFNELYKKLQDDANREIIGNDPFLQKNAIDKVNEFLSRYPKTQLSPDYSEDAVKNWTELPVKTLYVNTIRTLIDIINDIGDIISNNEVDGSVTTRRKLVDAFFRKDRRLYVGLLFIFFSFVLYFIDSAA